MGATNLFETEVLQHIFTNAEILHIGDFDGLLPSAVDGFFYVCLLSQDPGDPGAITNEATYGGYARVAVPRDDTGWSEANGVLRNFADINFPECTGGSETLTHFGICKSLSGDDMIFHGELPSPALLSIQVQPQFGPNTLEINMD